MPIFGNIWIEEQKEGRAQPVVAMEISERLSELEIRHSRVYMTLSRVRTLRDYLDSVLEQHKDGDNDVRG